MDIELSTRFAQIAAAGDVDKLILLWTKYGLDATSLGDKPFAVLPATEEELIVTSALHQAAAAGSTECVQWLLDHGADVQLCDVNCRTALGAAATMGHLHIVRLLCDAGAPTSRGTIWPDSCGERQLYALHCAASSSLQCMRELISRGAPCSVLDATSLNLLGSACVPRPTPVQHWGGAFGLPGTAPEPELLWNTMQEDQLPRILCALEAMTTAAYSKFPGGGLAANSERNCPRTQLDRWLGVSWPPFLLSVQSTLVLAQHGSHRCSGAGVYPFRGHEPEHLGTLPLLTAFTLQHAQGHMSSAADLKEWTALLLQPLPWGVKGGGPETHPCPQLAWTASTLSANAWVLQHFAAMAPVVWAHRYPPMAALARRFGLTCSPLYPCESGTVPYQLHDTGDWSFIPDHTSAWTIKRQQGSLGTAEWVKGGGALGKSFLLERFDTPFYKLKEATPAQMVGSVVSAIPLLLIARYGQVHGTTPHQDPASRFTRLLRARDDTWTSHLPCISAQDVQRCLLCFAAAVRHVCEVDSSLLPEVCARPVLAALLCWGWNARGRRSLVLRRAAAAKS